MNFPEKLLTLRTNLNLTQDEMALRLGLSSGNYVSQLEKGRRSGSAALEKHVALLEQALDAGLFLPDDRGIEMGDPIGAREIARPPGVPIISWAHAGESLQACYDELPVAWQDTIHYQTGDPKAFGLRLKGDSMAERYLDDDLLLITPSKELYSGCLAVLKLANDGVMFRQIERRPEFMRLMPLNKRYPVEEFPHEEIQWAYLMDVMVRFPNK